MPNTLPLSALQHYMYCPRQCALIHVEKVWVENRFTAEGRLLHLRADSGVPGRRGGIAEDRAVPLRSDRLGLYGIADVVEMRPNSTGQDVPYPVEYKRGQPKVDACDRVQVCAQAMCLEEMLGVRIEQGAIFYGKPRRREIVLLDTDLRELVERICADIHVMVEERRVPDAEYGPACRGCSLKSECMPKTTKRVAQYIKKYLES
ncbi:CRISPR-associated protein Cas4 [Pseudodesulfovibrio sp. JC047]|uniref:CRISPR-associated protein Cas4 n=1 Tax=Pseudodesulfovibrio sp. JC047 TaxID=2683199 RepID=UPI0013D03ADD|nr:CRISPR-associated protein Cas4 [Pseudodesulfovibrio sp. JC047]NDV19076.1 CRISPR-associated protein Cas4 [Pseudodesulfovibrio sp. JC047]